MGHFPDLHKCFFGLCVCIGIGIDSNAIVSSVGMLDSQRGAFTGEIMCYITCCSMAKFCLGNFAKFHFIRLQLFDVYDLQLLKLQMLHFMQTQKCSLTCFLIV